jgi:hypothetical protein
MSLCYVWCKPSTYLAPTLTLSQNRSKRESTRPTSLRGSIGRLQYYFRAYSTFNTNVHQSCIKSSTISKRTEPCFHLCLITEESHRVRPKWFLWLWYVRCKPCSYLELIVTLSPNRLKWDSTLPTTLTSSIGCVQSYYWCIGTFSANRVTILCQDLHYL